MERKKIKKKMPELPHDVEIEILARLPVKTLAKFEAVCSTWRATIKSPNFAKLQYSKNKNHVHKVLVQDFSSRSGNLYIDGRKVDPPIPENGFWVHPSDGGVILLAGWPSEVMSVWNPSTGKFRVIARPNNSHLHFFRGFHYDPASGGFIILIVGRDHHSTCVHIFNSDDDTWKIVDFPFQLNDRLTLFHQYNSKAFIHDGFHFLANGLVWSLSSEGKIITRFEPPPQIRSMLHNFATEVWDGRLCLKGIQNVYSRHLRIWVMEEYGNVESWTQCFKVPLQIPQSPSPLSPLQTRFSGHRPDVSPFEKVSTLLGKHAPLYLLENGRRILFRNNRTDLYVQDLDTGAMIKMPSLPEFQDQSEIVIETFTETLLGP